MFFILSVMGNSFENFIQFLSLIVVFILLLVVVYFVTRWIGGMEQRQYGNKNIKIIEGSRVGPNKVIQIVQVGKKFFVLGIGKDEISYLGEVKEEDLTISEENIKPLPDFKEILAKAKEKIPKNKNKK
jgi:flagellar protein FliO/FliZ